MLLHTGVARFLAACRQRQPDATPIWFMRQVGRCLTQYQELRQRYDILTMAKTPELCAGDANLGHGVLAPTDPDVLRRLVDAVHETTASFHTD